MKRINGRSDSLFQTGISQVGAPQAERSSVNIHRVLLRRFKWAALITGMVCALFALSLTVLKPTLALFIAESETAINTVTITKNEGGGLDE